MIPYSLIRSAAAAAAAADGPGATRTAAPPMAVGAVQHRHLEEHGWCVVKSVVEPSVAVRACSLIDGILGGAHGEVVPRGVDEGGNGRYQTGGAWPAPSSRLPVVLSGDYRHSILHPIGDTLMAELTVPLVEINARLLGCAPG
jgi:hypothetical protein